MQLCVWRTDWWAEFSKHYSEVSERTFLEVIEPERRAACKGDIRVEFHSDQRQLLVVGESLLAVYDGSILERLVEVIHSVVDADFFSFPCTL